MGISQISAGKAEWQCSVAGKVTAGLASHWRCDVVYPDAGSIASEMDRSTSPTFLCMISQRCGLLPNYCRLSCWDVDRGKQGKGDIPLQFCRSMTTFTCLPLLISYQMSKGKRPHRRLVIFRGCEWIRPMLTPSNTWFLGSTWVSPPNDI